MIGTQYTPPPSRSAEPASARGILATGHIGAGVVVCGCRDHPANGAANQSGAPALGTRREHALGVPDIDAFRRQLLADEERVEEQILLLDERSREAQTPDEVAFASEDTLADDAALASARERDLAFRRSLQSRLHDVQAALRKIDQGTYGVCESCGAEIPPPRLHAQPHAVLCVACKARAEGLR